MTPEQRKLARHDLGLPNGANRSYKCGKLSQYKDRTGAVEPESLMAGDNK